MNATTKTARAFGWGIFLARGMLERSLQHARERVASLFERGVGAAADRVLERAARIEHGLEDEAKGERNERDHTLRYLYHESLNVHRSDTLTARQLYEAIRNEKHWKATTDDLDVCQCEPCQCRRDHKVVSKAKLQP